MLKIKGSKAVSYYKLALKTHKEGYHCIALEYIKKAKGILNDVTEKSNSKLDKYAAIIDFSKLQGDILCVLGREDEGYKYYEICKNMDFKNTNVECSDVSKFINNVDRVKRLVSRIDRNNKKVKIGR